MYIYTFLITLIFTKIREGVGIMRGSVIGDFPLHMYTYVLRSYFSLDENSAK